MRFVFKYNLMQPQHNPRLLLPSPRLLLLESVKDAREQDLSFTFVTRRRPAVQTRMRAAAVRSERGGLLLWLSAYVMATRIRKRQGRRPR